MKKTILFMVFALIVVTNNAKADFTFGEPTNLGPPIWSPGYDPQGCCFSHDGLELYFASTARPGGYGSWDIWVATRETADAPWGEPVNLGPNVNSSEQEVTPAISPDGLELYFSLYHSYKIQVCKRPSKDAPWSNPEVLGPPIGDHPVRYPKVSPDGLSLYFASRRPGGYGLEDIWVSTRATTSDPWSEPINLGPNVNTRFIEVGSSISSDGLCLLFDSNRTGGYGSVDIWVATRTTTDAEWGPAVNYPSLNVFNRFPEDSPAIQNFAPAISPDGSVLYFDTPHTLWQSSITPVVDLNGDGIVDAGDMCVMVDHWGTDNSLCDIGPMPWGDGVVDVQDLIVLAEHLFEGLVAYWKLDETEGIFAADSTGDNDAVVLGGIEWQPSGGQINGALKLDGVSGYAIADFVLNPANGPFSIFVWIKGGVPGQAIISQQIVANWLATDENGNLVTELKSSDLLAGPLNSDTVITDGQWHRIGLVWDGSNRILCVDGVKVAEDAQHGLEGSQMGLYIGVDKNFTTGTFFSGLIDDIRIYNRAVSP